MNLKGDKNNYNWTTPSFGFALIVLAPSSNRCGPEICFDKNKFKVSLSNICRQRFQLLRHYCKHVFRVFFHFLFRKTIHGLYEFKSLEKKIKKKRKKRGKKRLGGCYQFGDGFSDLQGSTKVLGQVGVGSVNLTQRFEVTNSIVK